MEPERIGPYRTLTRIGSGRTGTVYLALDREGRTVAVRLLHSGTAGDQAGRTRLERVVAAMRRVHSPYVAEVIDADVWRPQPYIVTRYVQGRPLAELVRDRGPLAGEALWRIAGGLATAVSAIHRVGLVHRDLTPGNVMVADGRPVVVDIGVTHTADITRPHDVAAGTPGYVAPELLRGERIGPAADVFAWAATVGFAATGRHCFGGESATAIGHRVLNAEPDLAGVPADLLPGLRGALAKHPADRPPADELVGSGTPTYQAAGPTPEAAAAEAAAADAADTRPLGFAPLGGPEPPGGYRARAEVLDAMAEAAMSRGDHGEARELYEQSWQASVEIGDHNREAAALNGLGLAGLQCGDHGRARELFSRARQVCRLTGDRGREAYALTGLGDVARGHYDYPAAWGWYEQARRIGEEIGDRGCEAAGLTGLGEVSLQRGALDEAAGSFERARQIWAETGDRAQESFALSCLAEVALQRGGFSRAEGYYEWARQIGVEIGSWERQATALNGCGSVALQRGDLRRAEACYQRAQQMWTEIGDREMEAYSLNGLGDIARLRHDVGRARECYERARRISFEIGNGAREAYALWGLGQVARACGDPVQAQELWRRAAGILDRTGDPFVDVVRNSLSELG